MTTDSHTIVSMLLAVLVLCGVALDLRSAEITSRVFSVQDLEAVSHGKTKPSDPQPSASKPYRVLVVIGDQWDDPGSYVIDGRSRFSDPSRTSAKDFMDVVTMLTIWGIPFDILRLDQQRLQINRFLNGVAEPNYACLVWMADPDKLHGFSANYATLRRAVEDYGMSFIALFDYIKVPELAALVGIDYRDVVAATDHERNQGLKITSQHFITAGAVGAVAKGEPKSELAIARCAARSGTAVLGTLGGYPQLTARNIPGGSKAVWIGGGHDWFDKSAVMRTLFRNALVHTIGYGVFNDNFEDAYIFIMDDMGASEHAYSLRWHYPTPSKEEIVKYLVEPLEKHGLVMVQNVTPGYANPVTQMVEDPWTIKTFTDPFGNVQDYGSTKQGLDEGVRRGVFEVHAHRAWTHKNWDLDSPPGPWWDAPIDGERAHGHWYQETYDARRRAQVPSSDMLFIYRVGRDAIQRQFGVTPLAATVRPSTSLDHDNARLATIAGYGVDRWHYLGTDRVIQFSIREMCPEQFTCHDLDLVERTDGEITAPQRDVHSEPAEALLAAKVVGGRRINLRSNQWIESKKDKRWIGFNEYCAYLHSRIEVTEVGGMEIRFGYDPHHCRHFAKHVSHWTLELSDRYLERLSGKVLCTGDGKGEKRILSRRETLGLSAGVGSRHVVVRPDRSGRGPD